MEERILRTARREDLGDICRVWETSFGDAAETVRGLMGPEMLGTTTVAELGGRVRSLMAAFDGLVLGGARTSYILALCTEPDFHGRGLGEGVLREAVSAAFERGAELVCLHPASESLARWYEGLGLRVLSRVSYGPAAASGGVELERVGAGEYAALREGDAPAVPKALLRAQELFYSGGDGGLFALECGTRRGCVCVQRTENGVEIRELICPQEYRAAAAAEVLRRFGAPVRLPYPLPPDAERGGTHLMGACKTGAALNLKGMLYLPFTLD